MERQVKSILMVLCVALLFITLVHAVETTTPGEAVRQQLGINPEELPTTPEGFRDKYLSQKWSELIAKNKYLGPTHNFFLAHPLIFTILFGDPYAISLTFLIILLRATATNLPSTSGWILQVSTSSHTWKGADVKLILKMIFGLLRELP